MRSILKLTMVAVFAATGLISIVIISFAQQQPAPADPMPAALQNYQPVTAERLKNPEAGNWLMIRRTYDGWGYSPLDQINTQNVSRLRPVWSFATGEARVHESAPIVNNGVMFIATPICASGEMLRTSRAAAACAFKRATKALVASAGDFFCGGQLPCK